MYAHHKIGINAIIDIKTITKMLPIILFFIFKYFVSSEFYAIFFSFFESSVQEDYISSDYQKGYSYEYGKKIRKYKDKYSECYKHISEIQHIGDIKKLFF
jgi:hypothetical protein